jgi:hypothetical protein
MGAEETRECPRHWRADRIRTLSNAQSPRERLLSALSLRMIAADISFDGIPKKSKLAPTSRTEGDARSAPRTRPQGTRLNSARIGRAHRPDSSCRLRLRTWQTALPCGHGRSRCRAKQPGLKLVRRVEQIESLPIYQQRALLTTIDTFIAPPMPSSPGLSCVFGHMRRRHSSHNWEPPAAKVSVKAARIRAHESALSFSYCRLHPGNLGHLVESGLLSPSKLNNVKLARTAGMRSRMAQRLPRGYKLSGVHCTT